MATVPTKWADDTRTWSDALGAWSRAGVRELDATFEWSPSTAPAASPVWVDITDYVLGGTISRGRQSEFDRTSAGRMTLTLDNRDRMFDPEFNSSARPNKRIRASVGSASDIIYLFDGWIDALPQSYEDAPNDAQVSLTATDAFKVLARHELDEIYAPTVIADDPVAYWRLADDLPTATAAADSSGNGNTATWKGTPSSVGSLIADGPGAVNLEGSGDNVEGYTDGAVWKNTLAAAPVSIECWVKTGKHGTHQSFICGQTHAPSAASFIIDFGFGMSNVSGVPYFNAQVGGINVTLTGSTVIRDTGVHHLVGTVDSSRNCRFYVDGVLEAGPTAAGSTTAIDSSGSIRIGKTPVGSDPGAGSAYKSFDGEICEVAVYDTALSAARVLAHYQAGAAPWSGDTTGGRVTRVLNLIGWRSADRSIETGSSTLGTAAGVQGRSALDHLLAVEQTEQGRVFVSGDGKVTFYGRTHETTGAVVAEFDEDDYVDLMFDYSDANIINDCEVTRAGGTPQRATDPTSISAYWRNSERLSGLLYASDNEALAMAQWRVQNFSSPTVRPTGIEFVPLADIADLLPRVLSRELGDRIEVTRAPPEGSPVVVDAIIEGIAHQFTRREWVTSWNLSPLIFGTFGPGGGGGATYLRLNDSTLGQLNNNRLGF